jgi:hypothetical protein
MSAKTTAPAAVLGHRDPAAGALIIKAGKAAASMLQCCKEAAGKAAAQLNPAQPMGERIDAVCSLYADDFKAAGHNVRALFKDALTLHAAAQTPVTVAAIVDGKKADVHVTAGEALAMPKHAMRDAAKQVREANGFARKAGAGRKAKAENAAAVNATADGVEAFAAWLDNLEEYLTDATYKTRIVARLIEAGYRLEKATQGRKVTGSASA